MALGAVGVGVRALGAVGAPDHWLSVPLLGAFPWFGLWSVGVAIGVSVAAVRGGARRRTAAAAVVTAVVAVALMVPRTVATPQPSATGEAVVVATVNVRIGAADMDRLAAIALDRGVDLLAVIESTPGSSTALIAGPLGASLPAHEPTTKSVGGLVLARGGLAPLDGRPHAGGTPDALWTTPGGTRVAVTSLHATAPIGPTRTLRWRAGLARTPSAADGPALVLGDFNATLDHGSFRDLHDDGWRDAAAEVGAGLAWTYDGLADASPGLPMVIDHVLVGPGIAVDEVTSHDVPHTDHRLLVARLRLP